MKITAICALGAVATARHAVALDERPGGVGRITTLHKNIVTESDDLVGHCSGNFSHEKFLSVRWPTRGGRLPSRRALRKGRVVAGAARALKNFTAAAVDSSTQDFLLLEHEKTLLLLLQLNE